MSQTLYRKYRPKNFSEVIGQSHIVRTLSNSIKNNRIGHAYLFSGPRGTGKTSLARILAKTVNCVDAKKEIPCEKCPSCQIINSGKSLDIIEIDAASNTGVDNIRASRETVALSPSSLRYKIYIIDEAHMLSTGAFNALLKTLEEPPAFVIFILATTEIHKIPDTIISRCQRFDFTRLSFSHIIEKLSLIAKKEKVQIEKEALEMIALASEGGMRDAESLLGQIISLEDKNITAKEVQEITGSSDKKNVAILAKCIIEKKSSQAISVINELSADGIDLQVLAKSTINYLRQVLLLKVSPQLKKYLSYELTAEQIEKMIDLTKISQTEEIVSAIDFLNETQNKISSSVIPQLPLEMAVIKSTGKIPSRKKENEMERKFFEEEKLTSSSGSILEKEEEKILKQETSEKEENRQEKISPVPVPKTISKEKQELEEKKEIDPDLDIEKIRLNWKKLLLDIHPYNHSLSAFLSNCVAKKLEKNKVILATPYSFYQEKLSAPENRLTIEKVLGNILKANVYIEVEIDRNVVAPKEEKTPEKEGRQDSLIDDALEIMGGKIVEQ